jgi:NADPH-dependent glutamate synthase beta subunit-like oxidoreductase
VLDGLEYLRTATLGLPYPNHAGKRVVVIGGGFTSMDCSRTSIRQGASEVTLVYRRDMKDMPASDEVHEAIEEGVTAIFQAGPVRVVTDDSGNVTGVEFIRMQLGEPDASGRRRPEPAPGTEFTIPCDRVLLAIGQGPELDWASEPGNEGVEATKNRRLKADAVTFSTDAPASSGPAMCASVPRRSSRRSPRGGAPPTRSMPISRGWTSMPSGPARRSPSRSPSSSRSCRSPARSRSPATA